MTNEFASFLAIGDSFTEGLNDVLPDQSIGGWADRFALLLARQDPRTRYANLAIRGRLLQQVIDEQVPTALTSGADLISFCAGGNDLLRPGADVDDLADRYERAAIDLRATGARVLMFTGFDFGGTPVLRLTRGRVAIYNEHLRAIASRHGCDLVDLWAMRTLRDPRAVSVDRLHLSADGHERVARQVAAVLDVPAADPNEPWPGAAGPPATRRDDLIWARTQLMPWMGRHLRGRSSGDGLVPKRPELDVLDLRDERAG